MMIVVAFHGLFASRLVENKPNPGGKRKFLDLAGRESLN